jgi:hypothetical protein
LSILRGERFMATHKKWSSFIQNETHLCMEGYGSQRTEFEELEVRIVCPCGELLERYYRVLERERTRAKTDKSIIGRIVKVSKAVSWVGYAKNPSTVQLTRDQIREHMEQEIIKILSKVGVEISQSQAASLFFDCGRIEATMKNQAIYELRKKAYNKNRLPDRGIWYRKIQEGAKVEIAGVLSCWTGVAVRGRVGGYDEEWEPSYLSRSNYHQLYYGFEKNNRPTIYRPYNRVMIHPGDVLEIEPRERTWAQAKPV